MADCKSLNSQVCNLDVHVNHGNQKESYIKNNYNEQQVKHTFVLLLVGILMQCMLKFNPRILVGKTLDERESFKELSTIMLFLHCFVLLTKFKTASLSKVLAPLWKVLAAYQAVMNGVLLVSLCILLLSLSWKIQASVFCLFGSLGVCHLQDTHSSGGRMLLGLCLLGLLALMSFDMHENHMLVGLYFIQGTMYVLLDNYAINANIPLEQQPRAALIGRGISCTLFSLVQEMPNEDTLLTPVNLYLGTTGLLVVIAFYAMYPLHNCANRSPADQELNKPPGETLPNFKENFLDLKNCLCIVALFCVTALDSRFDYLLSSTMRNDSNLNENIESVSDSSLYLLLAVYEYFVGTSKTSPSSLKSTLSQELLMYVLAFQFLGFVGPHGFTGGWKDYWHTFAVVSLFRFGEKQTGELGAEKKLLESLDKNFSNLSSRVIVLLVNFMGNMLFRLFGMHRSYYCSLAHQVLLLACICGLTLNKSKKVE